MPGYIRAWQLFRQLSDEDRKTAEMLLTRRHWPRRNGVRIVDVGCGDGRILREVLTHVDSSHHDIVLLDPDEELLAIADRSIRGLDDITVAHIETLNQSLEESLPGMCVGADVVLAVHVVYLLELDAVRKLVDAMPIGVPLYVVLDNPGSVFSTLWERFAPEFLRRVRNVHQFIAGLRGGNVEVDSCVVTSRLENPLQHSSEGIRSSLISMLCYSDSRDMALEELEAAKQTIRRFATGSVVICESTCYEIVRTS